MSSKQKIGVAVMVLSLVIGIGGTVASIGWAFWALESVENAGLGPIGNSLRNALIFTVAGLVGTVGGGFLLIFGRSKSR